jgi:hypothetical protein
MGDILMRDKSTRGVFESLEDKVDLSAKCCDPLKFQAENDSEEDGVFWIREAVQEISIHMFCVIERRRWQGKGRWHPRKVTREEL